MTGSRRDLSSSLLGRGLRFFFQHLYHDLAWTYDAVAATVSFGAWYNWTDAVLTFVRGPAILEVGHGTGHLLRRLARLHKVHVVGLDESAQMSQLAKNRAVEWGTGFTGLTRGLAQQLPFKTDAFDSIVSTFPSEFIFAERTIFEIRRALKPDGRLIVLPVALIVGRRLLERLMAWGWTVTHQVPPAPEEMLQVRLGQPLVQAGFQVEIHRIEALSSTILVLVAMK